MEDGITILSKTEITDISAAGWVAIAFLIIGAIAFASGLEKYLNTMRKNRICLLLGIIMWVVAAAIFITGVCNKHTGRYEYNIAIDDSVGFNEFNDKYEIKEVEGLIYKVIEREEAD